jgi:hypothetical protein
VTETYCPHGRPIACGECATEYVAELAPSDQAQSSRAERAVEGDPLRSLDRLLGLTSEEDGTVVFRVLDDGSRHCQVRLVAGRGDDAGRAILDCCTKLGLPVAPVADSDRQALKNATLARMTYLVVSRLLDAFPEHYGKPGHGLLEAAHDARASMGELWNGAASLVELPPVAPAASPAAEAGKVELTAVGQFACPSCGADWIHTHDAQGQPEPSRGVVEHLEEQWSTVAGLKAALERIGRRPVPSPPAEAPERYVSEGRLTAEQFARDLFETECMEWRSLSAAVTQCLAAISDPTMHNAGKGQAVADLATRIKGLHPNVWTAAPNSVSPALRAEAGKAQAEWVAVSERKPDPNTMVQFHVPNYPARARFVGFWSDRYERFEDLTDPTGDGDPREHYDVTHWAPLLPPPSAPEGK